MEEQNIQCQKCNNFPEEYIQLNCEHNFCLLCLLVMESRSIQQDSDQLCEITCDICHKVTVLDKPSTEALMQTLNQVISQAEQQKNEQDDHQHHQQDDYQHYQQDDHQDYQQDDHQDYQQDDHQQYQQDNHQQYQQDDHQQYQQDNHQHYQQDDHQHYQQDNHQQHQQSFQQNQDQHQHYNQQNDQFSNQEHPKLVETSNDFGRKHSQYSKESDNNYQSRYKEHNSHDDQNQQNGFMFQQKQQDQSRQNQQIQQTQAIDTNNQKQFNGRLSGIVQFDFNYIQKQMGQSGVQENDSPNQELANSAVKIQPKKQISNESINNALKQKRQNNRIVLSEKSSVKQSSKELLKRQDTVESKVENDEQSEPKQQQNYQTNGIQFDKQVCLDSKSRMDIQNVDQNCQDMDLNRCIQENIFSIQNMINQCDIAIQQQKEIRLSIEKKQQQFNLPYFNMKQQIQQSFKEIVERLKSKESELNSQIDLKILESQQSQNLQKQSINSNISILQNIQDQQQMNLSYLKKELSDPRNLKEYLSISEQLKQDSNKIEQMEVAQANISPEDSPQFEHISKLIKKLQELSLEIYNLPKDNEDSAKYINQARKITDLLDHKSVNMNMTQMNNSSMLDFKNLRESNKLYFKQINNKFRGSHFFDDLSIKSGINSLNKKSYFRFLLKSEVKRPNNFPVCTSVNFATLRPQHSFQYRSPYKNNLQKSLCAFSTLEKQQTNFERKKMELLYSSSRFL